jgi:hypothetical protein
LGWLAPSLEQLSDAPTSYVNELQNSFDRNGIEFGIVQAKKDRVIAGSAVLLDGQRDFAAIDGHHGILTWYPQTSRLVENFLTTGSFESAEARHENRLRQPADVT